VEIERSCPAVLLDSCEAQITVVPETARPKARRDCDEPQGVAPHAMVFQSPPDLESLTTSPLWSLVT
jgi:hypothetical protein